MSLAIVHSQSPGRRRSPRVSVEAPGQRPAFADPGRPAETAVRESKDRVRSALLNAGFDFPARRITLNLAPRRPTSKDGGRSTWPSHSASSPPAASCPAPPSTAWSASGELALSGAIRPVRGVLPAALAARTQGAFWWYRRKMPKRPAWPAG
ncbi:magnesium chelatase domain-containing protein [Pseudomonas aeruginosa]